MRAKTRINRDPDSEIPPPVRLILIAGSDEILELESRIHQIELQLRTIGSQIPAVQHLRSVPGIGPLTSTALVAFIGDVRRFLSGRRLASFLGLTPREHSSGLSRRLGHISKRGDSYLRTLLTNGARSTLRAGRSKQNPSPLHTWALEVERRRGHNVAVIALANKLARIAWTVWKEERDFRLA